MKFPRYAEYKESGVEWLGEVPWHWGVGSVRWLTHRYSGGTPDKTNTAFWDEGTIPWLNSGAVNDCLIKEPSAYITDEAFANSSAKWIPKGALVMALAGQGKTKGMVAQLAIPATCNQSMAAIIPGSKIIAGFLFWWLNSNYQNIRNMAGGDLRDGLNLELLGNIQSPLPSIPEQSAIAAFLDRETGKIDALVAEQEKLIALLKEKRQAVISHAVTKGLNPDVPMKDSGVEWLGEVPGHWDIMALKRIASLRSGETINSDSIEEVGEYPVYGGNGFRGYTDAYTHEGFYPLIGRQGALCGNINYANGKFWASEHAVVVSLVQKVVQNWLGEILRIMNLNQYSVSAAQPGLSVEIISNLFLPVPPHAEQFAIVAYLDQQTAKLDTLTAEAKKAINLLKERRSALISAAVTGKINVRGMVDMEAT